MNHALLAAILLFAGSAAATHAGSAKILIYHHIGADTPTSTSVSEPVFDSHLALLEREGYDVVPLQRIVDTLLAGDSIASNQVAITFDDAYRSVFTNAAPRLRERGWPFTVFASTDSIDGGSPLYLTWDELRALETQGASIANHSRGHDHLLRRARGESMSEWQDRVEADVTQAQSRLEAELDHPPRFFAYPYGEFDASLADLITSLGFIAFGQQSGPVGVGTSPYAIPRFPVATGFDSLDSLAEKLRTEVLPLTDPPIPGALLGADASAPVLQLRLAAARDRPDRLTCFVNGQATASVRWIDRESGQIEIEAADALSPGRSKYTCTAPVRDRAGAHYWYSHLWMKPFPDGSWYID